MNFWRENSDIKEKVWIEFADSFLANFGAKIRILYTVPWVI